MAQEDRRERFCMVKFVASLGSRRVTLRATMMTHVAALWFNEIPCLCEGCVKFCDDMHRMAGMTDA